MKTVQFRTPDLEDDIVPKSIGQLEPLVKEQTVTRILKSPRNQGGVLSRLGYSYKDSLSKLLDQTTILPRFTLREIILLTNLTSTIRRTSSLVQGQTNKRILDTKITECKISIEEFITKLSLLVIENFSNYLDYHLPTLKVIIILIGRVKLADIRAILDIRVEVSVITLDTTKRFKILVIYSLGMALQTIVRNKSRFVGFANNVLVTINNTVVRTQFYIIDCLEIKVILGFLFI